MRSLLRRATLVVLLASVLALVAALPAATAGASTRGPFKVASTLDGKTVLPHRIHWVALPTLPAQIKEVDFLIDGKVAWIEHGAPYVYSDNDGPHRGYLVTSWLSPGKHRFSVRAHAGDGLDAEDTVVAGVGQPPEVPADLAGTWRRTITNTSNGLPPQSRFCRTSSYRRV